MTTTTKWRSSRCASHACNQLLFVIVLHLVHNRVESRFQFKWEKQQQHEIEITLWDARLRINGEKKWKWINSIDTGEREREKRNYIWMNNLFIFVISLISSMTRTSTMTRTTKWRSSRRASHACNQLLFVIVLLLVDNRVESRFQLEDENTKPERQEVKINQPKLYSLFFLSLSFSTGVD